MDLSMWQYFHICYNNKRGHEQTYIPYATGMNCTPIFPFTKSYALGSLIKHKPWSIKK